MATVDNELVFGLVAADWVLEFYFDMWPNQCLFLLSWDWARWNPCSLENIYPRSPQQLTKMLGRQEQWDLPGEKRLWDKSLSWKCTIFSYPLPGILSFSMSWMKTTHARATPSQKPLCEVPGNQQPERWRLQAWRNSDSLGSRLVTFQAASDFTPLSLGALWVAVFSFPVTLRKYLR